MVLFSQSRLLLKLLGGCWVFFLHGVETKNMIQLIKCTFLASKVCYWLFVTNWHTRINGMNWYSLVDSICLFEGCDLIYFILYYGWCFEPQHAWCSRSSINLALKVCKYCLYGSVMVGKGYCELMNGFNLSLTAYHQPIIVLYFHAICYTNFKILHSFVYLFDTVVFMFLLSGPLLAECL